MDSKLKSNSWFTCGSQMGCQYC